MAGKLVSSIGGQGPGGGGIMDILLPLGLGVAAAAHPALARGAGAITSAMSMAGRNQRLKEMMDLEQKREKMSEETHQNQQKLFPFQLESLKNQTAASQYSPPIPTHGGGYVRWNRATNQVEPFVPNYEGSEEQANALTKKGKVHTQQALEQQKALIPGEKEMVDYRTQAQFEKQRNLMKEKPPKPDLTPDAAMAKQMQLVNQMAAEYSKFTSGVDDEKPTAEQVELFVRRMHQKYKPLFEGLYPYMPKNYPKRTFMDTPPENYQPTKMTDPKYGRIWANPNDPQAQYWYPAVPYYGGY
jgi:hypothetical protein